MKRRDWIGGGRLTWGLILRGFPLGDGGVLANEIDLFPKLLGYGRDPSTTTTSTTTMSTLPRLSG